MRFLLPTVVAALAVLPATAQEPRGVAAKNIQTIRIASEALGEQRSVNILLPTDYETSTRRYPVLYLLHGYGDDHTTWSLRTNLSWYAAQYPFIIVMPDGAKSFYLNSAADPKAKFEQFMMRDLIGYVDRHYRTIPLRRARAVAGLSMGGFGAAFLGLKHARMFTALGSFSGAIGLPHNPPRTHTDEALRKRAIEIDSLFGAVGSPDRSARDPFVFVEKAQAANLPAIYISCGAQDTLLSQNRAFVQLMGEKNVAYEYHEIAPRVHSWDFWDEEIRVFLQFLSRREGFSAD
jgi:S-formylglutathione hydrolase